MFTQHAAFAVYFSLDDVPRSTATYKRFILSFTICRLQNRSCWNCVFGLVSFQPGLGSVQLYSTSERHRCSILFYCRVYTELTRCSTFIQPRLWYHSMPYEVQAVACTAVHGIRYCAVHSTINRFCFSNGMIAIVRSPRQSHRFYSDPTPCAAS